MRTKKWLLISIIAILSATPITAAAANGLTVVRSGSNVSSSYTEYLPKFSPASVLAKGAGSTISVTANTTTSPRKVQIQYSTDKNFKKNVKTKTFTNRKYKSTVYFGAYATKTSRGKMYTTNIFSFPSSVMDQGVAKAALKQKSRHASFAKAKAYAQSSGIISLTRSCISAKSTYKLSNIKYPKKYYVRIRNVYVDNNIFTKGNKTYFSAWKKVKVK